jgi:putative phage-type endonuclease
MLTKEQEEARKKGIGASEVADILGIGWKTPYELWLEKTGRVEREDISQKEHIIMGHLLEPVIATRYEQIKGKTLRKVNQTLYHKDYPFILCHIDRKIEGERKIVEIKTGNPFSKLWGEEGTDEIPVEYIAQVQYQMGITGYDDADLIVFRGTHDIRIYPFVRDQKAIDEMFSKVVHFWEYHVLQDIPPDATTRGDLSLMYKQTYDDFVEATDETLARISMLEERKRNIKLLESDNEKDAFEICKQIGSKAGVKFMDEPLMSYKADKNGKRTLRSMRKK